MGKRIQHSCSLVPRLFLPRTERGNEPGEEANTAAGREFTMYYVEDTPLALCFEQGVIALMLIESFTYVEDTPLALCFEQSVIAPMLIESFTYVEDTPLASCCEQSVIVPMLTESLSHM